MKTAIRLKSIARRASLLFLALLIIMLPLPRRWLLFEQDFAGMFHEFTSFSLYLADFALLPFLITALPWLRWRRPSPLEFKPLTYPLAALWLWTALSTWWAQEMLLALQLTLRLLLLLNLSWLIVRLKPGHKVVHLSLAAALALQAGAAIGQFWLQDDLGLRWLGEPDLIPQPGGHSILQVGQDYWLRAYGLTPHPNILGGLLVLCSLTLIAPFLRAPARYRFFWLLLQLAAAAALFYTFSRSAWLGGLIGGLFWLLLIGLHPPWRRIYFRRFLALLFCTAVLLALIGWNQRGLLLTRFFPDSSQAEIRSLDERAVLSRAAFEVIRRSPVLGVGARNAAVAMFPFVVASSNYTPQPVHNVPLLLLVELGPVGAGLWLWLMLLPLAYSLYQLHRRELDLSAVALASALLAFAVIDLFDFYAWGWGQGQLLRWIFWGLWGAAVSAARAR